MSVSTCAVESTAACSEMVPTGMTEMLLPLLSEAKDDDVVSVSIGERQAP